MDYLALLTPRQAIPAGIVQYLQSLFGREGVVDAQELYYHVWNVSRACQFTRKNLRGRNEPMFDLGARFDLLAG